MVTNTFLILQGGLTNFRSKRGSKEKMEVINLNKKIALLILGLVVISLLTAPVIAVSPQKIPVTARTYAQVNSEPEKEWETEGGILHEQGIVRTGNVMLNIQGQVPLIGTEREAMNIVENTQTGRTVVHSQKLVFTFEGGYFEGVKQSTEFNALPLEFTLEQHVVLQGFGVFEGQTLMLTQYWALAMWPNPPVYEGFLLTH